jgi:hypothetical protein
MILPQDGMARDRGGGGIDRTRTPAYNGVSHLFRRSPVKKHCTAALLALCAAASLAAQTDTSALPNLLDVNKYFSYFPVKKGEDVSDNDYVWASTDEDYDRFDTLGGHTDAIDTKLEFALLSYYSQPVINIRPVEAKNILPANNKTSELKLGAAVYQEMQILRFLGNTDAVGRHEGMIKFITDRGNVSRAEVEKYLKDGIAEVVNAEFNKVVFALDKGSSISYNAKLTVNSRTKEYTLSYERPSVENDDKQITAPSLNALLAEMRSGANRADFDQGCINQVTAQNANIPAVFLEKIGKDPRADLAAIITAFYLNPTNQTAYGAVRDVNVFYEVMRHISKDPTEATMCSVTQDAYLNVIAVLSSELAKQVVTDSRGRTSITLSVDVRNRLQLVW